MTAGPVTKRAKWPLVAWLLAVAGLLVVAGANAHLVYVAVASQPECVAHLKEAGTQAGESALRHWRTNMDVPISIGVTLAFTLSLYDTIHNAPHAYFDAATSLLFFLLIGRTLDHVMRERARSAVAGLARLAPAGATVIQDGRPLYIPVSEIEPGTAVLAGVGDRIPVDGVVEQGSSELDCSLVSGESWPRQAAPGDEVRAAASVSALARNGELLADRVRPDVRRAVEDLAGQGLAVEIVSGDREPVVRALASEFGIDTFLAELLPAEKVARIAAHETAGRKVLMVGDGLNDAPALSAAHVSMAPATAADIGRNAADFVFLNASLAAVSDALVISRRSRTLIFQNFALAAGYNAVAVPVAVLGYVTPLVAAVAMSLSSIIVVANALRLSTSKSVR